MQKNTSYNTRQKKLIEEYIKNYGESHFTVDSVCADLLKNGDRVGRTTVYRFFERLEKDGKLRKYVNERGQSTCYQYINNSECANHFHLKCEKCGALIHMQCNEMSALSRHIKSHHGFNIDPLKTVLYGVCEVCLKK